MTAAQRQLVIYWVLFGALLGIFLSLSLRHADVVMSLPVVAAAVFMSGWRQRRWKHVYVTPLMYLERTPRLYYSVAAIYAVLCTAILIHAFSNGTFLPQEMIEPFYVFAFFVAPLAWPVFKTEQMLFRSLRDAP